MELWFLFHNMLTRKNIQLKAIYCAKFSLVPAEAIKVCVIKVLSTVKFAWRF
ncbi:similar to RIKEN cDNA 1810030N24 (predicted), isoform CRA_b [Rattus norvegicus]|uniref:Similar to RIKEN cDNA 1810030N24 (Predicted), isoform CRA_b n=1 Tax=Rattus norvegicus TaxID=10116 RepID=A6IIN1_RAT|nr:similar to RIKEN cDNA 1810030N24 (predicted), isoform CRA_b [Rattus norvegicus]EDL98605.1 similar to RIKEN cDNA 1810030N24 (predicted), isoform CRA_b [Rattus norvegicus]